MNLELEETYKCIHCGLCLEECPTYRLLRVETESPRGRIHLTRAVAEGRIEATERFSEHIYLCLGCRACESVCPSGVRFGRILESARGLVGPHGSSQSRFITNVVLKWIIPYPGRLKFIVRLLWLYQRSGLQKLLRKLGFFKIFSSLGKVEALLPDIPNRFFSPLSEVFPADSERRYRIGLISGCVISIFLRHVNEATVRVLQKNGCEVVIPKGQVCCGALNVHNGEQEAARNMARRNIDAFLKHGLDAVIINSAGCGATLKEYGHLLQDDPDCAEKARAFSSLVKDISEFLVEIPLNRPSGKLDLRVTYQDPCHLAHGQRVRKQPREVINSIPGIELIEMKNSDRCCGSAGIYNLTHPDMSQEVLEEKIGNIVKTGADVLVAPNPGCMIQLGYGVKKHGMNIEVIHLVELLDRAYEAGNDA